jgi:hypothetical protein
MFNKTYFLLTFAKTYNAPAAKPSHWIAGSRAFTKRGLMQELAALQQ